MDIENGTCIPIGMLFLSGLALFAKPYSVIREKKYNIFGALIAYGHSIFSMDQPDLFSYLCLVFVMFSRPFIAALWQPSGKGLTSCLFCDV